MKASLLLSLTLAAVAVAEPLGFSNTQSWDSRYLQLSKTAPTFLAPGWKSRLLPSPPPTHNSRQTRDELTHLLQLQEQRTDASVSAIKREIKPAGHRFLSAYPLSHEGKKQKPHTYHLLHSANKELAKVVFYFKHHFDRVRPSYVELQLKTAIPNPAHPAYPSGHATQSMTFALLLAELHPSMREQLIEEAKRIAHNREIAGVHYRSDSEAGFALAQGLVKEFLHDPNFKLLLQKAQTEWR